MNKKPLLFFAGLGFLLVSVFSVPATSQSTGPGQKTGEKLFLILSSRFSDASTDEFIGYLKDNNFTIIRTLLKPILNASSSLSPSLCEGKFILAQYNSGVVPDALRIQIRDRSLLEKTDQAYGPNPNAGWKPTQSDTPQHSGNMVDPKVSTRFQQVESWVQSNDFQSKLKEVKVAVLDTGVSKHPSLDGAIRPILLSGFNFTLPLDQDGNSDLSRYKPNDFTDRYTAPNDEQDVTPSVVGVLGHGTGIASMIAGSSPTDNFLGVAAGVRILPIKVCDDSRDCDAFQVTAGICQAIKEKADVINLSLSGPKDCPAVEQVLRSAVERNITVVTAAGNYSPADSAKRLLEKRYPVDYAATNAGIIGVGAIDGSGESYNRRSRQTSGVKVMAPGTKVRVASLGKDAFVQTSGTSYAAAWVSGLAALLKAQDPNRTPKAIVEIIQNSATKLPCSSNLNDCGAGLINFAKALGVQAK